MGKRISFILVLSLIVSTATYGATNMKFSGAIEAEWRCTPENEWEGWDRLLLSSMLETGTNTKAVIVFVVLCQ